VRAIARSCAGVIAPSCALMTEQTPAAGMAEAIARRVSGPGLLLDLGLARVRVHCRQPWPFAQHFAAAYRHLEPCATGGDWADLHVDLRPGLGLRRWFRPQVRFLCDGQQIFEPFPAQQALPMLEWGVNWLIGRRLNHRLLLHAGTLARDGRALLMPALPGSGKSTLTAGLALRGWRLLSDEFGACDPDTGLMLPCVKPVALKNESIDVIRRFEPSAELGPVYTGTRKGGLPRLLFWAASPAGPPTPARPALLLVPRWQAGSPTVLERITPESAFTSLAFNAFNYAVLGAQGFRTVVRLVRQMALWRLVYSDLDDAVARIDALWSGLDQGQAAPPPLVDADASPAH
jgi:HprK-related kinase A